MAVMLTWLSVVLEQWTQRNNMRVYPGILSGQSYNVISSEYRPIYVKIGRDKYCGIESGKLDSRNYRNCCNKPLGFGHTYI